MQTIFSNPNSSHLSHINATPILSTSSLQERFRQPMIHSRYLLVEYDADSNLKIDGTVRFFIGLVLVSITLLLTLLLLYARCACLNSPPLSNSTTHVAAALGLDPVAISDLPVVMYGAAAEASAGAECCICLGIFGDADEVKILPQCRHCFHSQCLDKWLRNRSSCPLCRDMLRV